MISASALRAHSVVRAWRPPRSGSRPVDYKFTRFHTTALCAPPQAAATDRSQPRQRSIWERSPSCDFGAGPVIGAARHRRAAGRDLEAERLRHGAGRQVPRGAGVGDEPDGAVPPMADADRASSTSTASSAGRPSRLPGDNDGTTPVEPAEDSGRGLCLHRGHDRQGDRVGCASRRRSCPTSRSSCTTCRARAHAPHHVPIEWSAKYKGRFDAGWDVVRDEMLRGRKSWV